MLQNRVDNRIESDCEWFVMKTHNNRATTASALLKRINIATFIPFKQGFITNRNGKRVSSMRPIIPNLIFVKTTRSEIWSLKNRYDFLNLLYDRTLERSNWGEPMTVPSEQMELFIAFVKDNYDKIAIIEEFDALDLNRGELVMVTSGPFEGRVATYISVKGRRGRQIVVKIDGFIAVMATAEFTFERVANKSATIQSRTTYNNRDKTQRV